MAQLTAVIPDYKTHKEESIELVEVQNVDVMCTVFTHIVAMAFINSRLLPWNASIRG